MPSWPPIDPAGEAAARAASAGLLRHPVGAPVNGAARLQPAVPLVRRPGDGRSGPGRNTERDWRGQKRSNQTHASTTDPDARPARKSDGQSSRLAYAGHVLMENRNGLVSRVRLNHAIGTAERDAALLDTRPGRSGAAPCIGTAVRPRHRSRISRWRACEGDEGVRDVASAFVACDEPAEAVDPGEDARPGSCRRVEVVADGIRGRSPDRVPHERPGLPSRRDTGGPRRRGPALLSRLPGPWAGGPAGRSEASGP